MGCVLGVPGGVKTGGGGLLWRSNTLGGSDELRLLRLNLLFLNDLPDGHVLARE